MLFCIKHIIYFAFMPIQYSTYKYSWWITYLSLSVSLCRKSSSRFNTSRISCFSRSDKLLITFLAATKSEPKFVLLSPDRIGVLRLYAPISLGTPCPPTPPGLGSGGNCRNVDGCMGVAGNRARLQYKNECEKL